MNLSEVHTDSEIAVVAAAADEIWKEHFTPIIGKEQVAYMLERFQSREAITEMCRDGYCYYLAKISDSNTVAGYCGFRAEQHKMFLSKLYVRRQYRGLRVGRRLFEQVVQSARQNKLQKIYLTVNRQNTATIQIYHKMGFSVISTAKTDIGGGFVMDDYIMEYDVR